MYITFMLSNQTHAQPCTQVTFEQLMAGIFPAEEARLPYPSNRPQPRTINLRTEQLNHEFLTHCVSNINVFITQLGHILNHYVNEDMSQHYRHFEIPKASGGSRPINAPNIELKCHLTAIKNGLQASGIHAHKAAYAYVPKRCAKDAVERHQKTGHKYYLHMDLHNFFGS